MSKVKGNLVEVLSGVISGVLDGSIEPQQANAINGTVSQIIKIAKLKIEHGKNEIDGVCIATKQAPQVTISSDEKIRSRVYEYLSANGEATFKVIAEAIGVRWETVENVTRHELFETTGNIVAIKQQ